MGWFGGGNDRAQKEAAATESNRQAQIAQSTARINNIYDAPQRQAQYADFINAVRSKYVEDANKQKTIADLQTKFANARLGLSGGSRDADARRALGEEYSQGILNAENKAQAALGDLKSQDNTSRLNLIQLARSGADATTVTANAMANMGAAAQSAKSDALAKGLGDVFAQTTKAYQNQQTRAANLAGRAARGASLYGNEGF